MTDKELTHSWKATHKKCRCNEKNQRILPLTLLKTLSDQETRNIDITIDTIPATVVRFNLAL